jgi:20S proteasome alpha/beta subunit
VTLVVGIFCSDGIAIAADQQRTEGAMGSVTVGQPVTKVQVIGTNALFAASGHVGLGQQLGSVVERNKSKFRENPYHSLIREIQTGFRALVEPAFKTAGEAARVIGHQAAQMDVVCHSLLAAPFKDGMHLVEITPNCQVESIGAAMPFICLGSGKNSADPFLGFLRKVYWPAKPPTLIDGALAAYWTVKHCIDMRVQGVGFEVDVFTLEHVTGAQPRARQLANEELIEHNGFISGAEDAMRNVRTAMTAPPDQGPAPSEVPAKSG